MFGHAILSFQEYRFTSAPLTDRIEATLVQTGKDQQVRMHRPHEGVAGIGGEGGGKPDEEAKLLACHFLAS